MYAERSEFFQARPEMNILDFNARRLWLLKFRYRVIVCLSSLNASV
jgi:hypothetical protein